jgi:hypothetical protein
MYVVNRHIVILLESRESREHREKHPRAHKRYTISCTCSQKRRRDDGHCIHTRAFMEDSIDPKQWKRITVKPMTAPDNPDDSPNYGRPTERRAASPDTPAEAEE